MVPTAIFRSSDRAGHPLSTDLGLREQDSARWRGEALNLAGSVPFNPIGVTGRSRSHDGR